MSAIKPEVGKSVHYYREASYPNMVNSDPGPDPEGQPLAAIITHVLSDSTAKVPASEIKAPTETRVNLAVFDVNGAVYGRNDILLLQEGVPVAGTRFAEWPEHADARKKAEDAARKKTDDDAGKHVEAKHRPHR